METTDRICYPIHERPIVAFGDSLVRGTGSLDTGGFVGQLSNLIHEEIVNLGVPGETSLQGFARIESVLMYSPRMVIVLLGGNDTLHHIPEETTSDTIEAIIATLTAQGIDVILLGMGGNPLMEGNTAHYEDLARRHMIRCIPDIFRDVYGVPELMSDSIHPNKRGYEYFAQRMADIIQSNVK